MPLIRAGVVAASVSCAVVLGLSSGDGRVVPPSSAGGQSAGAAPSSTVSEGKRVRHHAEMPTMPAGSWSPSEVDPNGVQYTSDQPDPTGLPVIHSVYLYAKDAPNRFADYAPMFQAQQKRASYMLAGATGLGFRWDQRTGSDGRSYHDITVVKSKKASFTQLSSSQQFKHVTAELKAAGLNLASKKYLVWVDAPSRVCGESMGSDDASRAFGNAANRSTVSTLYRHYPTDTRTAPTDAHPEGLATGGFCSPVLHELTHAMGAVSTAAPHYGGGGHCGDDPQDLMCSATYTGRTYDPSLPIQYDSGNDDYLDPAADLHAGSTGKLPWWTVNLSKFLCPRGETPDTPDCGSPNNPAY